MEWWNDAQITSWVASLLWVPHHVAALIACFVAFLLLRHQADIHRRWATGPVIVAGMAFASAAGMSVYVTFTFVVAVALWLLALITRKGWLEVAMFVGAGAVALLWALSYLLGLRGPAGGAAFVEFAVRPFPLGIDFAQQIGIQPPDAIRSDRCQLRCFCPSTMCLNSDSFSPSAFCACGRLCVAGLRPAPTNWLPGRWS